MWYKLFCFHLDEVFFGALLILFGISLICKAIFKFNIPLWPLFGGIALIYLGLSMLTETARKNYCKKDKIERLH